MRLSIQPAMLVILDGFGYRSDAYYNAIAQAKMPHFKKWCQQYPHAILKASGTAVGLPKGMEGNSEVGHLTIGAGRIIQQPMSKWLAVIENGTFEQNAVLVQQFKKLNNADGVLHIIGLLSDAGVHAHEKQLYASIEMAVCAGIKRIIVHSILDGRDTPPQSAHIYLQRLSNFIKQYSAHQVIIGSVHGRFYAMDRDNNWERIEKSYRVLTEKNQNIAESWQKVLESNYAQNITDEFISPTQLCADTIIQNGDGILFCNVRPDRARELTASFVQPHFAHFVVKPINLTFFMTPVVYDKTLPTEVLFPRDVIKNTLKDVLAEHNKTIFTIAETEKYAHVTYFFRGENEEMVSTEMRLMIPSIPLKNYVDCPGMSADAITNAVLLSLCNDPADFYLINYANADMVGHSGNFEATVKAVECLDVQLQRLYEVIVEQMNGVLYITADHGKAEHMYDEDAQQPRTAHTTNPVPFLMVKKGLIDDSKDICVSLTQLSEIAPFILRNMNITVPDEMMRS